MTSHKDHSNRDGTPILMPHLIRCFMYLPTLDTTPLSMQDILERTLEMPTRRAHPERLTPDD